jgi:hypothetical protein
MSNDDTTKQIPTEDKIDSLISLVHQLVSDVQNLQSQVNALEQKVDVRLHETRPIWEGVLARLEDIEISMDKVRGMSHDTRGDLRELRRELREHLPALK